MLNTKECEHDVTAHPLPHHHVGRVGVVLPLDKEGGEEHGHLVGGEGEEDCVGEDGGEHDGEEHVPPPSDAVGGT